MSVSVDWKTKRFYLASEKWVPVVGHEIKVDKYIFCAIPIGDHINVSEVTSGSKVFSIFVEEATQMATTTKEGTMAVFEMIGMRLKSVIKKQKDVDVRIEKAREIAIERLGEMPPIEYVDIEWVVADQSAHLN